jgi:hypothetical protein
MAAPLPQVTATLKPIPHPQVVAPLTNVNGNARQVVEHVMTTDAERRSGKLVPNSLTFAQIQVNHILGYSLAKLYQDLKKAPVPAKLQALMNDLEVAMARRQEPHRLPEAASTRRSDHQSRQKVQPRA